MEEQDSFDTCASAYPFCITPFRARSDHEDMNISVRSLVNIFEHDTTLEQDIHDISGEACSEPERCVMVPVVTRETAMLPDVIPCIEAVDLCATSTTVVNDIEKVSWKHTEQQCAATTQIVHHGKLATKTKLEKKSVFSLWSSDKTLPSPGKEQKQQCQSMDAHCRLSPDINDNLPLSQWNQVKSNGYHTEDMHSVGHLAPDKSPAYSEATGEHSPPEWMKSRSQLRHVEPQPGLMSAQQAGQNKVMQNTTFIQALIEVMDRGPRHRQSSALTKVTPMKPMKPCRVKIPKHGCATAISQVQGLLQENSTNSHMCNGEDVLTRIERWTRVASSSDTEEFGDSDKEESLDFKAEGSLHPSGEEVVVDAESSGTSASWDVHGKTSSKESSEPKLKNAKLLREEPKLEAEAGPNHVSDLDFAAGQISEQLNMDASKQKVSLRQKGSLAKRRKPSRGSMRIQSQDVDHFIDSAEPHGDESGEEDEYEDDLQDENEAEKGDQSKEELEDMEKEQTELSTSPKVPLPGIGEAVHLKNASPPMQISQEAEDQVFSSPDVTGSPEEAKEDAPNWVKEALAKKRRASEKLLQKEKESNASSYDGDSPPPPAPWMKELRHVNPHLPTKVTTHHYSAKGLDKNSNETKLSPVNKEAKCNINESVKLSEKETLATESKDIDKSEEISNSSVITKNESPSASQANAADREVLIIESSKNHVTPVKSPPAARPLSPQATSPASSEPGGSESPSVPSWKMEIEQRKKTKAFIPSQRPTQPLKLGETPQWKKDLLERNKEKQKLGTDVTSPVSANSTASVTASESVTSPSWQQGVKLKKTTPSISKEPEDSVDEPVTEWTVDAVQRRARLANSGLLDSEGQG